MKCTHVLAFYQYNFLSTFFLLFIFVNKYFAFFVYNSFSIRINKQRNLSKSGEFYQFLNYSLQTYTDTPLSNKLSRQKPKNNNTDEKFQINQRTCWVTWWKKNIWKSESFHWARMTILTFSSFRRFCRTFFVRIHFKSPEI